MKLGVNVDHVATLRQARMGQYPDPVEAARRVQRAGADNVTCHLREDRRHIQDRDVLEIAKACTVPLNFEMAATSEMIAFAKKLRPRTVTIVPEKREEITTEGGLDCLTHAESLREAIRQLKDSGIEEVSLFIDPEEKAIEAAFNLGAHAVELHTGRLSDDRAQRPQRAREISRAAAKAFDLGLSVHAGHGLDFENIDLLRGLPIDSVQIGHALVAEAIFTGLESAVEKMKARLHSWG